MTPLIERVYEDCRDVLFKISDDAYLLRLTSSDPDEPDEDRELTEGQAGEWLSEAVYQLRPAGLVAA